MKRIALLSCIVVGLLLSSCGEEKVVLAPTITPYVTIAPVHAHFAAGMTIIQDGFNFPSDQSVVLHFVYPDGRDVPLDAIANNDGEIKHQYTVRPSDPTGEYVYYATYQETDENGNPGEVKQTATVSYRVIRPDIATQPLGDREMVFDGNDYIPGETVAIWVADRPGQWLPGSEPEPPDFACPPLPGTAAPTCNMMVRSDGTFKGCQQSSVDWLAVNTGTVPVAYTIHYGACGTLSNTARTGSYTFPESGSPIEDFIDWIADRIVDVGSWFTNLSGKSTVAEPLDNIELDWVVSESMASCDTDPLDAAGRAWYEPTFDDRLWEPLTLPTRDTIGLREDRFFRSVLNLTEPVPLVVKIASDDGGWMYVNGDYVGHWGGDCGRAGCVGRPPGCSGPETLINLQPFLQAGPNTIAIHIHNGACCNSYLSLEVLGDATLQPQTEETPEPDDTPSPTTPEVVMIDNTEMVRVPAGFFTMGSTLEEVEAAVATCERTGGPMSCAEFRNEYPPRDVLIDYDYHIDRYEVSNAAYASCVGAGFCEPPKRRESLTRPNYYDNPEYADYPVINVTWFDAVTFCEWRGARLPTEAEWEKAARHDPATGQNYLYPWGEAALTCERANYWTCVQETDSVYNRPAGQSPVGAFNMLGNVAEWVYDWFDPRYYDEGDVLNPTGPDTGITRDIRGASWGNPEVMQRTTFRGMDDDWSPDTYTHYLGFRCARTAE